ncbi:MAG: dihydroorotase [Halothiobacillaceae bacterium]|nr:MAG: dihydroorotase [Halothiobacillaceae bacterium]
MRLHIRGGRVIDPANQVDAVCDLWIADGRIVAVGSAIAPALPYYTPSMALNAMADFTADQTIHATGLIVCPGLVDLSARLGEPGDDHKATIASEALAAVRGGFTTLCCPPDTNPVIDTPAVVELIHQKAALSGLVRIVTHGALTQGLKGAHLSNMASLKEAGCVGVSNGYP